MLIQKFALASALCLVLASCGSTTNDDVSEAGSTPTPTQAAQSPSPSPLPSPSEVASESPTKPTASGTVITVQDSEFGPMLFDARGQAIYLFELETDPKPRCYDECAVEWPPVLTKGAPVAKGKARQDLLGTTRRSDGTTQVTYKGHPLYFYANEGPGQVLCHDFLEYGALWFVVQPNGDAAPA